jgi:hypothetical protein
MMFQGDTSCYPALELLFLHLFLSRSVSLWDILIILAKFWLPYSNYFRAAIISQSIAICVTVTLRLIEFHNRLKQFDGRIAGRLLESPKHVFRRIIQHLSRLLGVRLVSFLGLNRRLAGQKCTRKPKIVFHELSEADLGVDDLPSLNLRGMSFLRRAIDLLTPKGQMADLKRYFIAEPHTLRAQVTAVCVRQMRASRSGSRLSAPSGWRAKICRVETSVSFVTG